MRILVTGGARRIGAGIARRLALRGHSVAIHHHNAAEAAQALCDAIAAAGGKAFPLQGELTDAATAPALIHAAREALDGPIDGLVNNASQFAFDALPLTDFTLLDRHMRINLGAPVALASALASQDDLEQGAVVNLLDQKIANLNPDFLTYTLSKSALAAATELMARGLAPHIRVNAVSPGLTLPSLDQTPEQFSEHARQNLLQRPVALDDIAATVEYLLTTRSITGQNIFVDCGQRFQRDSDVMFDGRERPMPDYTIHLEDLHVTMGLGIHAVERAAPQRVVLSVAMTCRYDATPDDRIDAVVDYDFLREQILALAASRHFELQEVLCDQVAALALADPRVTRVRVRSMKPDIYPDARIGCEIERSR